MYPRITNNRDDNDDDDDDEGEDEGATKLRRAKRIKQRQVKKPAHDDESAGKFKAVRKAPRMRMPSGFELDEDVLDDIDEYLQED